MTENAEECVVVTGASSGIGRASAIRFAQEGAKVAVADVDTEGGRQTVESIASEGGEAVFIETDISNPEDVRSLFEQTADEFGDITVIHNNAGYDGVTAPTADQSIEEWDKVMGTNLRGTWLGMKYGIPYLLESPRDGTVINTVSVRGLASREGVSPYVASKHGVIGLTKTAARDYGPEGIRINAVCPGPTDTPMMSNVPSDDDSPQEMFASQVPLGRIADPSEIANAVVWLCSDEASFVNGSTLRVDGGQIA